MKTLLHFVLALLSACAWLPAQASDPSSIIGSSALIGCMSPSGLNAMMVAPCASANATNTFTFTSQGTITLGGNCLQAYGSPGSGSWVSAVACGATSSPITAETRKGGGNGRLVAGGATSSPITAQTWKRGSNGSLVAGGSNLCLGIYSPNANLHMVDLEPCNGSATQRWQLPKVPVGWPALPTADVAGRTLSTTQVNSVVDWIQGETSISTTPFCFKGKSYDRGIGIAPSNCGSGQTQRGALCYDQCRSGYKDNGTLTCLQSSCPSGYNDTGLTCHYAGTTSYVPGTHWDNCVRHAPKWLGGGCEGGLVTDSCRSGFSNTGGVCYVQLSVPAGMGGTALDPTKGSYNLVGSSPTCNSNRRLESGLCYVAPKPGFACNVANCQAKCVSGTTDCGPVACASDANQCAIAITNMVVSPLMFIANIATAGVAGEAKNAVLTAENAYKVAQLAGDLESAALILQSQIQQYMAMAEKNLGAISTSDVAKQVAAQYGSGTPNYRAVARAYAVRQLLVFIDQTLISLDTMMITMLDETQTASVILAFAQPTCTDHTAIPKY